MRAAWRTLIVTAVMAGTVLAAGGIAAAEHLIIEVSAPDEGVIGEELEITATVREASTGEPVDGAVVVYWSDATFAGVIGEFELGRAETNEIGVATLQPTFAVSRLHNIRVEIADEPDVEPESIALPIRVGSQLFESEAGLAIPGIGAWLVPAVILAAWTIMIIAGLGIVAVSRNSGEDGEAAGPAPDGSRLNVAVVIASVMILLAVGLFALLVRSPETHSNLNPTGYDRTAVAYLEATYLYPGPGHAAEALTGDSIEDGRILFMSKGCAGCHGVDGQGTAAARSPAFATRLWLGTVSRTGQPGGMPAYSEEDLTNEQLDAIHAFLLDARDRLAGEEPVATTSAPTTEPPATSEPPPTATPSDEPAAAVSFATDVLPIFEANCVGCHGVAGGWTATDYDSAINSGSSGAAVIPGNVADSILALKITGNQTSGGMMPPGQLMSQEDIETILAWIEGGAEQ